MNKFFTRGAVAGAVLVVLSVPMLANAESNVQTGAGTLTATARLDFRVILAHPKHCSMHFLLR